MRRLGFRDDREALRARADALEAQLRERDERFARIEERLEAVERELAARREPAPSPAPGVLASRPLWLPIAAAAGVALLVTLASAALESDPEPAPPPSPAPAPAPAAPLFPSEVLAPPPPPEPPVLEPPPPPAGDVRWSATVASVSGEVEGLEVGAECVVEGQARTLRFASVRGDEVVLAIRCGERTLYDASEAATGMSSRELALYEQEASEGFHHWLRGSDRGVREGRTEMTIDTPAGAARVFRSDGSLDVRLHVTPRSELRAGRRLAWRSAPPPLQVALERAAIVERVEGELGVSPGATCSLRIEPPSEPNDPGSFNCRARVRCGGRYVYGHGTSGWNLCEVDADGAPVRLSDGSDTDGDPMLDADLEAGTLSIGSATGERSGRAVLTLR